MNRTLRREKVMQSLGKIHGQQYRDAHILSIVIDFKESKILDQSKASEAKPLKRCRFHPDVSPVAEQRRQQSIVQVLPRFAPRPCGRVQILFILGKDFI